MYMLDKDVIKNNIAFDIIFVYHIAFFLFIVKHNNDFKILPPSNGYMGNKLNITIIIFAYIILLSFSFWNINVIAITNMFTNGPANATNIFFTSNIFDFSIFLL